MKSLNNDVVVTCSLVLYKTEPVQLQTIIDCITASQVIDKVYFIDNSPDDSLRSHCALVKNAEYIFNNSNLGYGSAHNIAIKHAIEIQSTYHIVLNPDIYFEKNVIHKLIDFMETNQDAVYVLPRVEYPNGELQYLCKLLPSPIDLIFRRFLPKKTMAMIKRNDRYTLKQSGYDRIMNPPCLSGCFMFMRTKALTQHQIFFDERYFMYCEDFDLIRRLHRVGKTLFYPDVKIIHNHAKESYSNKKMLYAHIKSAITYFNKYGWIFDSERSIENKKILQELGLK